MNTRDTNHQQPSVPVTWPELIARNRDPLNSGLERLRELPGEIVAAAEDPLNTEPAAESLLGVSGMLSQAAVVYGPQKCEEYWDLLLPLLPLAFKEIGTEITRDNRVLASSLLSLVNVARCCGANFPPELHTTAEIAEQQWPSRMTGFVAQMNERERWTLAFSALIADDTNTVITAAGGGPLPDQFDPASVFDFNVQGFIRHLAVARGTNATMISILPSLRNFIHRFPHKLAAGTLTWDHLLYAGRTVFSTIGDEPASAVAPTMYALISELALGGST